MTTYTDTDLVYVDPDGKKVIGLVEWKKNGSVQPREREEQNTARSDDNGKPVRRKPRKKRYYPWCTYKTAKKVFHVDGKFKEKEAQRTLDEVIVRALQEPYWDD